MEKNTLLDFLTQRASEKVTAEFQQVLGDATKEERDQILRSLFKTNNLDWFYSMDKKEPLRDVVPEGGKGFFKDLGNSIMKGIKQLPGDAFNYLRGKDPLDMTPTDLDNLVKIYRDQTSKPQEITILLSPEDLKANKSTASMAAIVANFYMKNKEFFDSARDCTYDKKTKEFNYKGPEVKLDELFEQLAVKPDRISSIKKQIKEVTGLWYLPFGPGQNSLDDWTRDPAFPDFKTFKQALDAEIADLQKSGDLGKSSVAEWVTVGKQEYLKYQGSLTELKGILSFIREGVVSAILKRIRESASLYKQEPKEERAPKPKELKKETSPAPPLKSKPKKTG
jgi:hypothetical protein